MVASDYYFKCENIEFDLNVHKMSTNLHYLKKHLMNIESNGLCPKSFKPIYSVDMKIYVSKIKYEMVVIDLCFDFQDYL